MPSRSTLTVLDGVVADGTTTAFQGSAALVSDVTGKSRTVRIGDELPGGLRVNDSRKGKAGVDVEVVNPEGSLEVIRAPLVSLAREYARASPVGEFRDARVLPSANIYMPAPDDSLDLFADLLGGR